MNTATISLHCQYALIKFRKLKNLVSIMKRTITLLCKVLVIRLASVWYMRLLYFYLHFTDAAGSEALPCDCPMSAGVQLYSQFLLFSDPLGVVLTAQMQTDLMPVCLDILFAVVF